MCNVRGSLVHIVVSFLLVFSGVAHVALLSPSNAAPALEGVGDDAGRSRALALVADGGGSCDMIAARAPQKLARAAVRRGERGCAGAAYAARTTAMVRSTAPVLPEATFSRQQVAAARIQNKYKAVTSRQQTLP